MIVREAFDTKTHKSNKKKLIKKRYEKKFEREKRKNIKIKIRQSRISRSSDTRLPKKNC